MQNNSKEAKAHKNQRTKIMVFIGNWAGEMFSHAHNLEDQLELLIILRRVYLDSSWADNREERRNVIWLFDELEELFNGLNKYGKDDFNGLDHWILEQTKIAS